MNKAGIYKKLREINAESPMTYNQWKYYLHLLDIINKKYNSISDEKDLKQFQHTLRTYKSVSRQKYN